MKFIADCHLGKVAKYLRIFGFDTLFFQSIADDDIIEMAKQEDRIVLTSDRGLFERLPERTLYIEHGDFETQLRFIFKELELYSKINPFTRCIECNGELKKVSKNEVMGEVKFKTQIFHDDFNKCDKCGRIYWEGDHFKKMRSWVDEFLKER